MYKDIIRILLSVFALALVGCTFLPEKPTNNIPTLNIPSSCEEDKGLFDALFSLSDYVILEANDTSLIRHINKVTIYDDCIYVLDKSEKRILAFARDGRFVREYKHYGQGLGEYLYLSDFAIYDGVLYLLDKVGGCILSYTLDDLFLAKIPIGKSEGIHILDKGKYALNNGLGIADKKSSKTFFSYMVYDELESVYQSVPYNTYMCGYSYSLGSGANYFYEYEDTLFTYFPYNDTIYTVGKEGFLTPYLSVNLGETITPGMSARKVERLRKERPANIFSFYKWQNRILFSYIPVESGRRVYVVAEDNRVIFHGQFNADENGLPINAVAYDTDEAEHKMLSVIEPTLLHFALNRKKQEESTFLQEIATQVVEDDNPVLLFYDMMTPR